MKKMKKIAIFLICLMMLTNVEIFAHKGRTDVNGGHKDKNNVSGLGAYHYHCGGYPAHLHKNGVCPYKTTTKKSSKKTTKKTTTTTKKASTTTKKYSSTTVKKEQTKVLAEKITIKEKDIELEVGENKTLTATISPSNVTDKSITWKTSDENVVKVSSKGKITGISKGEAKITATTVNNKEYTVKVIVEEEKVVQTLSTNIYEEKDYIQNNSDESSVGSALLGYGVVGGAGYIGYKKYKKKKEN